MQEVSGSIPLGSTIASDHRPVSAAIDLDHRKAYFSPLDSLPGRASAGRPAGINRVTQLSHYVRSVGLGATALALVCALPAQAQFGGISFGKKKTADTTTTTDGCPTGKKKSTGSAIFGAIAGQVAGNVVGRTGFGSWLPIPAVAETLTNAIACRLDPKEQQQAADATLAVTRGDEKTGTIAVGQTAEWTSASRKDVKGKSTIVAVEQVPAAPVASPGKGKGKDVGKSSKGGTQLASASQCITVSDVVIVAGEETTASKRMCKAPGQARYTLMA